MDKESQMSYLKGQDYYPYYGAGCIQLTWDYNYKDFSEEMADSKILELGPEYVAENYAWAAAGWFWSNNNINAKIADGATVRDVTRIVRGSYDSYEERETYYNEAFQVLGG